MSDKNKPEAKPVEELVFSDDFMFGAVMRNEEICREALECLLGEKISRVEYTKLKRSIIIFLCRFDPYKKGLPCYTIRRKCEQDETVELKDDAVVHVFNCRAYARVKNPELRAFLKYVQENKAESDLTRRIEDMVADKKLLEGWSYSYLREYLYEMELKAEGREEGEKEKALSDARNLLAMGLLSHEQIAQATDLPLEEVEKLATGLSS